MQQAGRPSLRPGTLEVMSILLPDNDLGFLRADAPDLDKKLRTGDGIQWTGDPTLFLSQGVVEETSYGRPTGKIVARRWEVWRTCEDGMDRLIGHWRMEEFDRILYDLARMRAEAPGHEDAIDAIERKNIENEKRIWKRGRDSYGEMLNHLASIYVERSQGRNTFRQVGGSDERPDRNLA